MSPRLIVVLVAVGLVAFCTAFFRTGKPDIAGLDRPSITFKNMAQNVEEGAKPAAGNVQSRFKEEDAEIKKKAPRKKNTKTSKARKNKRLDKIKEARKKARIKRTTGANYKDNKNIIRPKKDMRSRVKGFRRGSDDREEEFNGQYGEELVNPGIMNEDVGIAEEEENDQGGAPLMENIIVE